MHKQKVTERFPENNIFFGDQAPLIAGSGWLPPPLPPPPQSEGLDLPRQRHKPIKN